MKRTISLIIIIFLTLSCDRYEDPSVELLKDYSFYFYTDYNRYFAGEWVGDSIQFHAIDNNAPFEDPISVDFEIVKGGGEVTVSSTNTDNFGFTWTKWKLGTESFEQVLRANTYDIAGNYLNSSDLIAYGFRTDTWDTLKNSFEAGITSMAADTVNKITLITAYNDLFRQGERYYEWKNVFHSYGYYVKSINIDNNGVFYLTTQYGGGLYKSTDHGESWKNCTDPYSNEVSGTYYLSITNDNYLWVFAYNRPAKYSKDSGETWIEAGSELYSQNKCDIFRLTDGSLLFHGSNCCSLYRSFDDGSTWTHIETPGYSVKLFVNEKDEIFIVTQEGGIVIYKSTDYGVTFKRVHSVGPEWGTSFDNTFIKCGDFYYVFIPYWGILKSTDLEHYEVYWVNKNLRYLYMDHNGVLLGKYMNLEVTNYDNNTVYYRKNSE